MKMARKKSSTLKTISDAALERASGGAGQIVVRGGLAVAGVAGAGAVVGGFAGPPIRREYLEWKHGKSLREAYVPHGTPENARLQIAPLPCNQVKINGRDSVFCPDAQ